MKDPLQELRDDRAALLQLIREAIKLINMLLEVHEEIEQDHAIGRFAKEDFDGFRRTVNEIEECLRG